MSTQAEPWKDPDELHDLYHGHDMDQSEMADEWDTTASTVSYWMNKLGVDTTHTQHADNSGPRGPEFCVRCEFYRTPGGADSRNEACDRCIDYKRRKVRERNQ